MRMHGRQAAGFDRLPGRRYFAYCSAVHGKMTDATGSAIVKFMAAGRRAEAMPKLSVLEYNTHHTFEHYGNIVTYMRLKGLVPPSSQ